MHKLTTPIWILKHIFALFILANFIGLGIWQLNRLEERRASNASFLAALDIPAVSINDVPVEDLESLSYHTIKVKGTYNNEETILYRNQTQENVNGVDLITPLYLENSDRAVLVDRGWLPESLSGAQTLPNFNVDGVVQVTGIVSLGQTRPDSWLAARDLPRPGETRIPAWLRVDIAGIQNQVDGKLLPIYIRESPTSEKTDAEYPKPLAPEALSEGPHLVYALQWFSFAIILVIVYVLMIRSELKDNKKALK